MSSPTLGSQPSTGSVVVFATAAAFLLRLPGHLGSGLWFDEIWTLVDIGRAPLGVVLGTYPGDNHHPLFSLLAWLSLRAFGESAWALRLPAVVFGALSVGMLWLYAARVVRPVEATLATALLATSYHHVWFSQNARGYTALLFFTLAATYFFEDLIVGRGGRSLLAYASMMALAVYTHLTAVFFALAHLVAAGVWWRLDPAQTPERRASWRLPLAGIGLAAVLSLLLYAPMAREMASYFWAKATAAEELAGELPARAATVWTSTEWAVATAAESLGLGLIGGLAALALGGAVVLWGAISHARESPGRLIAWVLPGGLLIVVLGLLGRNLWPRLFFPFAGFIVLVLVRGWTRLARARIPRGVDSRRAEWLAAALLWIVWTALLPRAYALPKQDFEGARDFLERVRRPGEVVATTGVATLPYQRYYATDYVAVESVAELEELRRRSASVYVVSTLPEFLRSRRPELAAALATRSREVARFRGSVGDGDIVISRFGAAIEEVDEP